MAAGPCPPGIPPSRLRRLNVAYGGGPLPSGHPAESAAPPQRCLWRRAPALRASRRDAVGPQPHGTGAGYLAVALSTLMRPRQVWLLASQPTPLSAVSSRRVTAVCWL